MQRAHRFLGQALSPLALLSLSTLVSAQAVSNTQGTPAVRAAQTPSAPAISAPATRRVVTGQGNASAVTAPTTGAGFETYTQSFATTCIIGVEGDTTLGGGWGAFDAASGLSMEVLVSGVADFTDITSIPSSLGNLTLSPAHNKRTIGSGWGTWSHGYTGEVFYSNGATAATYTMPHDISGFDMYVEPNPFALHTFTATGYCSDGSTAVVMVDADGTSGANHFGFFTTPGNTITHVELTGTADWAIGEIRMGARDCITGFAGDTTLVGGWGAFEAAAGMPMEILNSGGVADFTDIPGLASSLGAVAFDVLHNKRTIGSGWGTWSHGYTGEVFYTNGSTSTTYTMPGGARAFDLYVEPNPFSLEPFTAVGTCSDGSTATVNFSADGTSGANHCGFFTLPGKTLVSVQVTGNVDFAIGELRISDGGLGTAYCEATANSTGFGAQISSYGSASVSANNFTLRAGPVPNQFGLFFHGANKNQIPFGNGFLCVTGGIVRLNPPTISSGGFATRPVNLIGGGFGPGTRQFQYWFRDPAGGGAAFNTSNGLSVTFLP